MIDRKEVKIIMIVEEIINKYKNNIIYVFKDNDDYRNRVKIEDHLHAPVKTYVVIPKKAQNKMHIII